MGKRVLIDTDILIDYYRRKLELNPEDIYYVSEITAYEFMRGTRNIEEAKEILEESFSIEWLNNRVMKKASEIWRDLKGKGQLVDDRDLMIGATAIERGFKLLTRNVAHYGKLRKYGLSLYREK